MYYRARVDSVNIAQGTAQVGGGREEVGRDRER